ncbi:MAG TPA: DUF4870 domain-containing protein [Ktedonobacterales bacterium]|jgi:uncharacterized membrane protein
MAYDPNQQYQQPPQYPPPGQQGYQQPGGYPPPGYQQPMVVQNPVAQQLGPSSIGIDANIAAALSYFWIIGLIFFLIEKKNRFVRFHALQSLFYGVGLVIVGVIFDYLGSYFFFGFSCLGGLIHVAWLVGAIYAAVQAYNGKWFKLPVVGDMAYNNAMAWVPPDGGMAGVPPMANTQYPPQGGYPPQQPGNYPQSGPGQYPPQQPPGQWPQQ